MPRTTDSPARHKSKKRILKAVKGHRGSAGHLLRLAKDAAIRSEVNARVGRKLKKRDFRSLWITRLSAACRQRGVRYSEFINGCKKAGISLNRKMLSEIAIADPAAFDAIVEATKTTES